MKGWKIGIVVLLLAALIEFFAVQWNPSGWEPPQQEESWELPQQQEETTDIAQEPWQQVQQEEIPEPTQEQEATAPTENQAENYIESNTDYASYLVMTASPHIITDSYGFRYIVGSFKNISSVELDYISVSFRLYDKDGNQVGNAIDGVDDLLPGKTWNYKACIWENEASYFELAEINVYP